MLNLTPHRRFQIPNGLAVFAAVLLIGSSIAGFNKTPNDIGVINDGDPVSVVKEIDKDIASIGESVKKNGRVLKLGLQLFQR
jgi:hypothetical protein